MLGLGLGITKPKAVAGIPVGSPLGDYVSSCVFDIDATIAASYGGSGQNWLNLEATPADGSAQSAYDFILGSTSGVDATDLTFTGTAGNAAAYMLSDGADFAKMAGAITTFLRDIHKPLTGSNFTICGAFRFVQNDATQVIFATSLSSTVPGLRVVTNSSEKLQLIQRDEAGVNNSNTSSTTLVNGTDYAFCLSYNHSTGVTKFWINSFTQETDKTTAFGAATTSANGTGSFGAESDGGVPMPSGTRLYALSAFNEAFDNAKAIAVLGAYNARHARSYAS